MPSPASCSPPDSRSAVPQRARMKTWIPASTLCAGARRTDAAAAGRRRRRGPSSRPDRSHCARQHRSRRTGARRPCGRPFRCSADLPIAVGRAADPLPRGRVAGVDRLGAEPHRPDGAADGSPARLDDLSHGGQPAAEQGFGRTVAATAFRRPASIPRTRRGDQPHRNRRPRAARHRGDGHRAPTHPTAPSYALRRRTAWMPSSTIGAIPASRYSARQLSPRRCRGL